MLPIRTKLLKILPTAEIGKRSGPVKLHQNDLYTSVCH